MQTTFAILSSIFLNPFLSWKHCRNSNHVLNYSIVNAKRYLDPPKMFIYKVITLPDNPGSLQHRHHSAQLHNHCPWYKVSQESREIKPKYKLTTQAVYSTDTIQHTSTITVPDAWRAKNLEKLNQKGKLVTRWSNPKGLFHTCRPRSWSCSENIKRRLYNTQCWFLPRTAVYGIFITEA